VSVRLLPAAARVAVPWKNGGGVMHEVAEEADRPEERDAYARCRWRVGTAEIVRDGPFSVFPGIDRLFVPIAGNGVGLTVEGRPQALLWPGDPPLGFPGEAATSSFLLDGPVRALNVMVRRGAATAAMTRHVLAAGEARVLAPGIIVIVETGRIACGGIEAGPLDAFAGDERSGMPVDTASGATLWHVAITRVR
jgi:uncharacterized protein